MKRLERISSDINDKKKKKYRVQTLIDLCQKLNDKQYIENEVLIQETVELLDDLSKNSELKAKSYLKSFFQLRMVVKQKYGYIPKGQLKEEYIGAGVAIGVGLGVALSVVNPVLLAVGIPVGVALGAAFGEKKEKAAEEKGLLY